MATVTRAEHQLGKREDLTTLRQTFRFAGEGANAEAVSEILLVAPLTGTGSIFGSRPGKEVEVAGEEVRSLTGFSPVAGFQFDVRIERQGPGLFLVHFSQPDRGVACLNGDLVWRITDSDGGSDLTEAINTEDAMEIAGEPLGGDRPSLRRWLFFRMGHKQVVNGATANIAKLLTRHDA